VVACATVPPKGRRATIRNQPKRRSRPRLALALLLAAGAALPACAQSLLPGGTQPARSLPAKVVRPVRLGTVEPRTMLRNVTILRGQTSVEVHIEASGKVKPVAMVLSQPDRIVVDLADVGFADSRHIAINTGDVEGVRVALFHADPPVTRVVVDLARPHDYRLLPAGSTVIVAIDTRQKPAIAAQPAEPKIAAPTDNVPPPAVAPVAAAPASATEAKLQPPIISPPTPPSSGVSRAEAPAASSPQTPSDRVTQPSVPTVSTALPQVATIPLPVPVSTAPLSGEEETTPHQAAKGQKPGVVRSVIVSREKDGVEVHIEGSKPLRASASTLSNPERIIIDLANVRLAHARRIPVHEADVQAVNVSLYLVNPLVTRVVVDLTRPHPYHVQASGNSLTVRIDTGIETAGSQPVQ